MGSSQRRAFSLIELVIVVVIIGIIAAIAIPRMSRGVSGSADAVLTEDLGTLRRAIEMYKAEHDANPPALAMIVADLTLYSSPDGASALGNQDAGHPFGPYLKAVPTLPVGSNKGATGIGASNGAGIGWIYDETTGDIKANTTTEQDDSGRAYNTY